MAELFTPGNPVHEKAQHLLDSELIAWFTTVGEDGTPHAVRSKTSGCRSTNSFSNSKPSSGWSPKNSSRGEVTRRASAAG